MNIYDEALIVVGEQSTGNNNEGKVKDMFEYKLLVKAIKRAKKVEELNKLLNKKCYFLVDIMNNYNGLQDNYIQLLGEIDVLEKELEELN